MTSSRPWLSNCRNHSRGVIYEAACTGLGGQDNLEAALLGGDVTEAKQDNNMFDFLPTMARGKKSSVEQTQTITRATQISDAAYSAVSNAVSSLGWSIIPTGLSFDNVHA